MGRAFLRLSSSFFSSCARPILRSAPGLSIFTEYRRFRALFGVSPLVCASAWNLIGLSMPPKSRPCHLLWALMFLKTYASEHSNRIISGADEKTFRKWCWIFVNLVSNLKICWENRFCGRNNYRCQVSVDGTDCRIYEPKPFNSKWYSHKSHGPGVRYEVGVCISTGDIVWVHGPFECGAYSDAKIYKMAMKGALLPGEKVVADGGYRDGTCEKIPSSFDICGQFHALARARHETVNRRCKQFSIISQRFRHNLSLHSCCFHAVANLAQITLERGGPLFGVSCN